MNSWEHLLGSNISSTRPRICSSARSYLAGPPAAVVAGSCHRPVVVDIAVPVPVVAIPDLFAGRRSSSVGTLPGGPYAAHRTWCRSSGVGPVAACHQSWWPQLEGIRDRD